MAFIAVLNTHLFVLAAGLGSDSHSDLPQCCAKNFSGWDIIELIFSVEFQGNRLYFLCYFLPFTLFLLSFHIILLFLTSDNRMSTCSVIDSPCKIHNCNAPSFVANSLASCLYLCLRISSYVDSERCQCVITGGIDRLNSRQVSSRSQSSSIRDTRAEIETWADGNNNQNARSGGRYMGRKRGALKVKEEEKEAKINFLLMIMKLWIIYM